MPGDCFVVLSEKGCYWDGNGWVADEERAQRFICSERADAWKDCEDLRQRLMRETGLVCFPLYLPCRARKSARKSTKGSSLSGNAPPHRPSLKT